MTPREKRFTERLHVMVRPDTKRKLNVIARADRRFNSEADVVRFLLEQHLESLMPGGGDPFADAQRPDYQSRPDIRRDPVAIRPPAAVPA